jgi:hypothetical protein
LCLREFQDQLLHGMRGVREEGESFGIATTLEDGIGGFGV